MTSDNYSNQLEDLITQYKTENPCQMKLNDDDDYDRIIYNKILRKELKKFYITYLVPDYSPQYSYFDSFWARTMLLHLIKLEDSGITKDMVGLSFINQFNGVLSGCTIFYKGQLFNL